MARPTLLRSALRTWDGIQDVLFPSPPDCSLCLGPTPGSWTTTVCDRCLDRLPHIHRSRCGRCGRAMSRSASGKSTFSLRRRDVCSECRERPPAVDYARAYGVYDGYLRQSIQRLKFEGELRIAQGLGQLMAWVVAADGRFGRIDAVMAVPLHPARQRERGYNQAEALARVVAKELGKKLIRPAVRVQEGTPQAKLPWNQRRANLQRAFSVPLPDVVAGRRLLLVDDVWTTGSTLSSLALALKRAGSSSCMAICAAASSLDREFTS